MNFSRLGKPWQSKLDKEEALILSDVDRTNRMQSLLRLLAQKHQKIPLACWHAFAVASGN
jgi:hypothetical protein